MASRGNLKSSKTWEFNPSDSTHAHNCFPFKIAGAARLPPKSGYLTGETSL